MTNEELIEIRRARDMCDYGDPFKVARAKRILSGLLGDGEPDDTEPADATKDDAPLEFLVTKIPGLETHVFNGVEFGIFTEHESKEGHGWCSPRSDKDGPPMLWIHANTAGLHKIEVAIHEGLHACLEELTETQVDTIAADVSTFVRRLLFATEPGLRGRAHRQWGEEMARRDAKPPRDARDADRRATGGVSGDAPQKGQSGDVISDPR